MKKRRVLLKLSGEALAGEKKTGFDEATVRAVAEQVKVIIDEGIELAVVIGGGNFWRGRSSDAIERTKADQIGMLATVMNCIYVSEIFRSVGMKTKVMTPFAVGAFTELFSKDRAVEVLEKGTVVFFAGGTGHPYFSTDTGVVLRAIEMEADEILLAKAVDGVYDSDPKINPDAKKYDEISIDEVVRLGLGVVDGAAAVMAKENRVPMLVFGLGEKNSIARAARGEISGTKVTA
ncbi:MAG: UMP kinase [Lachnospiraceae bacterium]|nr:UMP kinase [Lachnospiraceae bacterium]